MDVRTTPNPHPDPLADYYEDIGDYYNRFTTVSIFQRKYFPHDDPDLLFILNKHLENPNARRRPIVKVIKAFARDKRNHKERLHRDHMRGLQTKLWVSFIPTGYLATPKNFFAKIQERRPDGKHLCHLCLVHMNPDIFPRHYRRHFVLPNVTKKTRKPRRTIPKTTVTIKTLGSNGSIKIKRRVLRTKTTVITKPSNVDL
ncbi:hypothetical protein WDU94_009747 [Cyamophila willieti]